MTRSISWMGSARQADEVSETASVFQVVAYNLALARRERGMTQDQLGERLEELTGTPWSRATVSAAESGWTAKSTRVRHFDANEIVAFALALKLPIAWFFLPPAEGPDGRPRDALVPWIHVSKADRPRPPAMSTGILRWIALHQSDINDSDELMSRRLRRDGVEPHSDRQDIVGKLYELVLQLKLAERADEGRQEP